MNTLQTANDFQITINGYLENLIEEFHTTVPNAKHLIDLNSELNESYYLRHRIETVKRIRLTAAHDAIALSKLISVNYEAARLWGRYTYQEMNHDKMYLSDLKKHQLTEEHVFKVPLFQATIALDNFLRSQLDILGPITAIAYSLFVEWNSDKYSKYAVQKAEKKYSEEHVEGSKKHVEFDENDGHINLMFELSYKLIENSGNTLEQFYFLINSINQHFCNYFSELYEATLCKAHKEFHQESPAK